MVNYRRSTRRLSHSTHQEEQKVQGSEGSGKVDVVPRARPPLRKFATTAGVQSRIGDQLSPDKPSPPAAIKSSASSSFPSGGRPIPITSPLASPATPKPSNGQPHQRVFGRSTSGFESDSEDEEVPEVSLDRNQHIIPQWMLRGSGRSSQHRPRHNSHSVAVQSARSYPVHGSSPLAPGAKHEELRDQEKEVEKDGDSTDEPATAIDTLPNTPVNSPPRERHHTLPRPAMSPLQNKNTTIQR